MKRIIPVLIGAALLLSSCSSTQSVVNTNEAKASAPEEIYLFGGKVEANEKVNLSSKISAKISDITVDVGSRVKEGQALVYLDTRDIAAQVNQAQAALNTAKASLVKVQSGSRPEQIASAQAALNNAKTAYDNAQKNYDRTNELFNAGVMTQQNLEDAAGRLETAKSQYESAQDQLNMLLKGETKETVNVSQAGVEQAQAALELAKTQLSFGTISSPIDGVVSSKIINQGELASPGQTILTIVNPGNLYVNCYVPLGLINRIKVGQDVIVKVSDLNDEKFQGKISEINPEVDSRSKNVLVKVSVKGANLNLKPGMFAEIGFKSKAGVK